MRATIIDGPRRGDAAITIGRPGATVGDLAAALGAPGAATLTIAGKVVTAATPLAEAGLHPGATVAIGAESSERAPVAPCAPAVHVVGGLDAGHVRPLPHGGGVLGRGPGSDVALPSATVSLRHARVSVVRAGAGEEVAAVIELEDLGSRNGTWVEGVAVTGARQVAPAAVVRTGAVALRIGPPCPNDAAPAGHARSRVGGTQSFNRPPRALPPRPAPPLSLPEPPRAPAPAARVGVAVVLGPVAMAAAMAVAFGNLRFALLALLSPLLAVLSAVDGRARARRTTRREAARHAAELFELEAALAARRAEELRRRREGTPDLAEVVRRAEAGSTRLWERRPCHPDFLVVGAGTAGGAWDLPVAGGRALTAAAAESLAPLRCLPDVPVPVALAPGEVVGVAGDRAAALAVARSLLCQVAVHTGPADVRVALVIDPDRLAAWDWAGWLPHLAVGDGCARPPVATTAARGRSLAERLRAAPPVPATLVVVDVDGPGGGVSRALLAGGGPASGIVLAPTVAELPSRCTTVVELVGADGLARVHRPALGEVVDDALAAGLSDATARRCARHLARFEDPEAEQVAAVPVAVPLLALLDQPLPARAVPVDRPGAAADGPGVMAPASPATATGAFGAAPDAHGAPRPAPIGVAADGPVSVDVVRSGTVVVGEGTGSSDVLRTAALALAAANATRALSLLLVDGDGSGALEPLARLPHVAGHVASVGDAQAARLVEVLGDEVGRRRSGAGTVGAGEPRLVVVVDAVASLARRHPELGAALVSLAVQGPGVGIHLLGAAGPAPAAPGLPRGPGAPAVAQLESLAGAVLSPGRCGRVELRQRGDDPVQLRMADAAQAAPVLGRAVVVTRSSLLVVPPDPTAGADPAAAPAPPGPARGDGAHAPQPAEPATDPGAGGLAGVVALIAGRTEGPRARQLWADDHGGTPLPAPAAVPPLGALLGLGEPDLAGLDLDVAWKPRPARALLRVPIGIDDEGATVDLDLKEAAHGGIGPHGLVVGATGSGKSELLRTLVTGLALTHPPEDVGLVLVDFKGGATFAGLAALPHVAGSVTNLAGDAALVDRLQASISGELRRRQEVLRAAGDLSSIDEHRARRLAGTGLDPLPRLVVIVDEFAELLAARPELLELFGAVGRLGRSLGVHLLLASQRLDEGRLRGLESHLGYRIALRTFTAADSRAVLGTSDAAALPPEPGTGYLQVGAAGPRRFRAALATAPPDPPTLGAPHAHGTPTSTTPDVAPDTPGATPDVATLAAVVRRLAGARPRTHQVWLPPLAPTYRLDELLAQVEVDPARGLTATAWPALGRLVVPLGLVDDPEAQARTPLLVDLSGAAGNVAVVGAPRSGTSTVLQTLVTALLLTHTPAEVQVYAVDDGAGALAPLAGAPHVGAVAERSDPERVRAVVAHVAAVLAAREAQGRQRGSGTPAAPGAAPPGTGDVILVIDGWPALRATFEDLEPVVVDLAARGLGCGVHVVVSANRWLDVRPNLRDSLGSRIELRLADPADSAVDRRTAALVPMVAGRGLTADGLHLQIALPALDDRHGSPAAALVRLAERLGEAWSGGSAPPVRTLPPRVAPDALVVPGDEDLPGVPVGLAEPDLEVVRLDLTAGDPHLLVYGDGESGKTTLLRTFLTQLCARSTPDQVRVLLIDPRRGLLDVVPPALLLADVAAPPAAAEAVARLRRALDERSPGPAVTSSQLRDRSWWTGPELYVVVDDADLLAAPTASPLAPLLDVLAQGRDLGLHVVLARRVAGTGRAAFEPVLQRLRDLGSPAILLAGDPGEGPLAGGHRAGDLPPGRGLLVRRRRPATLIQVADAAPPPEPPGRA